MANLMALFMSSNRKRMYGALKRANKEVEFIELKHEGHYGWSLENEIIYHEALEKFLADNLR